MKAEAMKAQGMDEQQLVAGILPRVIEWQRQIHSDPEIGFDTVRTAALVAKELRAAGLAVREGIGRTGVVADLERPGSQRRIAFRADMDALPMEEENDLPHRSRNPGAAHLCGHDAHTAMLMGAATVLAGQPDTLQCSLRFIFQPNEEALPGGAPAMIADGCLDGVDQIFGMHVWPSLATGRIGIHPGPTMARPDNFQVLLEGKGGHAATPHENRDPIVGAGHIITAVQSIVSRNVDPLEAAVVSVTQVHGGSADNVIPARCLLRGTIRSFRKEVADLSWRRFREIVEGIAGALELTATVSFVEGYPVVDNDPDSCAAAARAIEGAIPVDHSVAPTLGGEDFAYYLEHLPGAFLYLGNRDEARGLVHFCHHPRFQVDDESLPVGVRTWLRVASEAR